MGLLGKIQNKVHQGILGAKNVTVKATKFINDNGLLPYIYGVMAADVMEMPIILPAIGFHQMYKHMKEIKKQETPYDPDKNSDTLNKALYNKRGYEVIPPNKIIDDSEVQQSTNLNNFMARKPTQE